MQEEESDKEDEEAASSKGPDYDYLLGMTLWSLTLEKKNELLKKRDEKIQELRSLQAKSPAHLWRDDLDAFLQKVGCNFSNNFFLVFLYFASLYFYLLFQLDEVEKKELEEENSVKQPKGKGDKAKFGKLKLKAVETMPSPVGRRVQPKIAEDDKKKLERLDQAARNAKDGIKKERRIKVCNFFCNFVFYM